MRYISYSFLVIAFSGLVSGWCWAQRISWVVFPPLQFFGEEFVKNWDYFVLKYLWESISEAVFGCCFLCGKSSTTNYISLINVELLEWFLLETTLSVGSFKESFCLTYFVLKYLVWLYSLNICERPDCKVQGTWWWFSWWHRNISGS